MLLDCHYFVGRSVLMVYIGSYRSLKLAYALLGDLSPLGESLMRGLTVFVVVFLPAVSSTTCSPTTSPSVRSEGAWLPPSLLPGSASWACSSCTAPHRPRGASWRRRTVSTSSASDTTSEADKMDQQLPVELPIKDSLRKGQPPNKGHYCGPLSYFL